MRGAVLCALAMLLSGCLSGAGSTPWRCAQADFHATSSLAWAGLPEGRPGAAARGWPLPAGEPGPGANLTDVRWRPDGGSPMADDVGVETFDGTRRTAVVLYVLQWWPLDGRTEADMPWLSATYSAPVNATEVAADLDRFLDLVGGPADRAAFTQAFVASARDIEGAGAGLHVRDAQGREAQPPRTVVAKEFGVRWSGPDLAQTLVPALRAHAEWHERTLASGALALSADLPRQSYTVEQGNVTFRVVAWSDGRIDGIGQATVPELDWEVRARDALASAGLEHTGFVLGAVSSSPCV